MKRVTFIFSGVALGFLKDVKDEGEVTDKKKWIIIFPFDNCHKAQFEYFGEYIPLNKPKTKISVKVIGKNKPSDFASDDVYKKEVFNLTAADVHPNLKLQQDWHTKGALLEIPNAILSTQNWTKSRYQLNKNNRLARDLNRIAFSVKAVIDLDAGESVEISVKQDGEDHIDFPKTVTGENGNDIIYFNNNCDGNPSSEKGDLQLLYENIIDVPASDQFTVDRHPDDMPKLGDLLNIDPTSIVKEPFKLTQILTIGLEELMELIIGKAAILNHNPRPKELGLPCYFTVADKTDSLNLGIAETNESITDENKPDKE